MVSIEQLLKRWDERTEGGRDEGKYRGKDQGREKMMKGGMEGGRQRKRMSRKGGTGWISKLSDREGRESGVGELTINRVK